MPRNLSCATSCSWRRDLVHTYIHTYIHTYSHPYMHLTYIHTCRFKNIHTCILTYTNTYVHTHPLYIHTYIHACMHAYEDKYIHMNTKVNVDTFSFFIIMDLKPMSHYIRVSAFQILIFKAERIFATKTESFIFSFLLTIPSLVTNMQDWDI